MNTFSRPRQYSVSQLAKAGVDLEDLDRAILRCTECGQGWSPNFQRGGKLPRGYWKCPNGCNNPSN